MDNIQNGGTSPPPVPVPPLAFAIGAVASSSSSRTSRHTSHSSSVHSRRSLKSLEQLLGDQRDPRKLQKLVHKLYEQLRFEKERADYADRQSSEAMSYLRSICEEKLRALRDISKLEEELKLYKIQYHEAQKEIFRAQDLLGEIDEKRYRAEKEAADARSSARKLKDEINVMRAQEDGRREGLQDGFRKGRELGYQEGLRIAQAESEGSGRARAASQAADRPGSRSRGANQVPEPQAQQRRHSQAHSAPPSGPPTAVSPTSPTGTQGAANHPAQPIPEMPEEPEIIRPRSFRDPAHSPRMTAPVIPPDNFIPHLDGDNRIHLPPPFEFSRPLERLQSPTSGVQENEEPRMIPPPISTGVRIHRSSSPGSASTTLSQMDMITDPYYDLGRSPMSAIPEALSQEGSPETRDVASARYQPSLSAQSTRIMTPGPNEGIYNRPRPTSGASSISFQPPPVIPDGNPRASVSTSSTTPGITILGPSAPPTSATEGQFNFSRTGPIYSNPNTSESSFLPPIPEAHSHDVDPVNQPRPSHDYFNQQGINSPMSQSSQVAGEWGGGNNSADSMNPPVIPHPDLFAGGGEDGEDEEAVSSDMESMDSFTTPPAKNHQLPSKAGSVRSAGGSALSYGHRTDGGGDIAGGGASRHHASVSGSRAGGSRAGSALGSSYGAGSAVGTIPNNRWDEVLRSVQNPPMGMLPVGFYPNTETGGTPAKASSSRKGRTPSMSTSRSGQQ